jgi:phenylacetate-CoA ligase
VPVTLIQDKDFHARQDALQLLCSAWTGAQVGEPQVALWGAEREVLQGTIEPKYRLANAITNRTLLNAYQMSNAHMRQYIEVLNTTRPKLIIAYVQAIYELARFAAREGLALQPQRAIIATAGTLYPFMRATIEAAFRCPVYDRYGSREVGDIACECPAHQGLHVLPWGAYVEVVDEAGRPVPAGTEGRLLVTCLYNEAMPLVRYDIGDRGALVPDDAPPCACGRGGQRLARITGRTTDMFVTKDGTLIEGTYFRPYYDDQMYEWVWKFQVIQERVDCIRYLIVKTDVPCPEADLERIRTYAQAALGADCVVHFEFVDEIPLLASGKYRYAISLVTS